MITQASSGAAVSVIGRNVSASKPRACRASALLPASREAFNSTARSIGTPFQLVMVTFGLNVECVKPGCTLTTTYFRTGGLLS
jgi:hypothetical protein